MPPVCPDVLLRALGVCLAQFGRPALHALGQHPALQAAHNPLREETLVAFLDDVFAVVHRPDRVGHVHGTLAHQLEAHCHVRLNKGKTRVWNAAGQVPRDLGQPGMPDLSCWVGAGPLPDAEQGLIVLGFPFGSAAFVRTQLQVSRAGHDQLLQRLPGLDDLQAFWLLLLFCCSPRCNYAPPVGYGRVRRRPRLGCSVHLCGLSWRGWPSRPCSSRRIAQFPLSLGGLGLVSAAQTSVSAYWASWAGCLPVLGQHLPPAAQGSGSTRAVFSGCCHNTRRAQPGGLDSPEPRAGLSSVTVCRRRRCRKTGPPPSLADGKGCPRAPPCPILPTCSASSFSGACAFRCHFPSATAGVVAGVVVFKAPRLLLHAAAKSGHTRSCSARSAAAWLSWPSRFGAGGVTRQPPLCAPSRRERCRSVSGPAWSLCLLLAGPHSCPTQPCRLLLPPSPSGRGHSAMPTVRSRPWVSLLQMQVRRPSPPAGCLPASCTSHSRWPPGYKWLVCLPCPGSP